MKLTNAKHLLLCALFLLVCTVATPTPSSAAPAPSATGIALDFKDVELTDLIKTISELTGRNFIYDERVRGKVTIISPGTMDMEEAYQLFLTVLSVKGFTLVPSGSANKIVPLQDAKQSNLPISNRQQGESYITQLIRLEYADAQLLSATVLMPLIPKTSNLTVYEPTNTLILTDSAANIGRLVTIIKKLDIPASLDQFEIFTLQQANAEEIALIANALLNKPTATRRRKVVANSPTQPGQVIAYARTNTLIAIAAEDELSLLRNLIKALDVPGDQDRSNINVYYLKNADAETLAKTLNEIMTGSKRSVADAKGQPAATGPLVITADKPTNALVINAGVEDFGLIKQVIEKLDIQRNQVYVEALILELSMGATRDLGVSLQGAVGYNGDSVALGTSNFNLGSLAPAEDSTSGIPSLLTQSIQGLMLGGLFGLVETVGPSGEIIKIPALSALIKLSQTSSDINILSAPRLLTSDNEEAEIIVGANVPIITNRLTDAGGSGNLASSVAVERKDVALTLRFTPQVTEGNLVRLNVFQEITAIAGDQSAAIVTSVGPTFTKRQIRNTVLAENGKTVVLGGLIGTNVQKTDSKVPLLGDIPFLGRLFRSTGTTSEKTNLLVFITPHVIHDASEMAELTRRSQLTAQALQTQELRDAVKLQSLLIDIPAELESAPATQETPTQDE